MQRRHFLRLSGTVALGTWFSGGIWRSAALASGATVVSGPGPYGPLQPADANGLMLPPGFSSRVVAEAGVTVPGTSHVWHGFPDGGAVFPTSDGGWIYVSNAEIPLAGGVGALRFDAAANVLAAYPILQGTTLNCAGGRTPWGTWLSCEEFETANSAGHVFECDPYGLQPAVMRPALGGFQHEAAAVDPIGRRRVWLTEDQPDGCFYRFTADVAQDLSSGLLEVAEVVDDGTGGPGGTVLWHAVPTPDPDLAGGDLPTRHQVAAAMPFDGGEGVVWAGGVVYFTTKGDDRVWVYDPESDALGVHYDAALDPGQQLTGVDNITANAAGELFVAEDGGNMELVVLTPEGEAAPVLRVLGQDGSELTGPAFDPQQRRLYLSSQRGGGGAGITYEITGPFRLRLSC